MRPYGGCGAFLARAPAADRAIVVGPSTWPISSDCQTLRPVCVDTALAPASVDRAGGSSPHPAKPLVLTRWSTWVVRETAGQSASGPMSRTSPKLASTRTPVPSMRTVVPWSPPNSICHRRCDRNICQSPAPSGCLCRPPARRRCRWRLQRGPWLTAASGHRRWGLGLVDVDDAAGVVRDREVELSTVRIGDLADQTRRLPSSWS